MYTYIHIYIERCNYIYCVYIYIERDIHGTGVASRLLSEKSDAVWQQESF